MWRSVGERIERAAERAGRRPEEITLVGVSKTFPAERIHEAFDLGVRHFGESRMQEWEAKAPVVEDLGATWHLVGHLQRNKAARAIRLFHTIDSLDSLPLAEKLERAAGDGRRLPVLIEVRLDPAAKKTGCDPRGASAPGRRRAPDAASGIARPDDGSALVAGSCSRRAPSFAGCANCAMESRKQLDWPLPELSMGMSRDFEIAIEEGATQIRVGTALFGARGRPR